MASTFAVAAVAAPASAELVYDNSDIFVGTVVPLPNQELGDEVTLAGSGRVVVSFTFQYQGAFDADGDERARIRFRANDGPGGEPHSVLFDSGYFSITPAPSTGTVIFDFLDVTVPNTFTWTIELDGIEQVAPDLANIPRYDPPGVGSSDPSFLWRRDVDTWTKLTIPQANLFLRIEATTGVPALPGWAVLLTGVLLLGVTPRLVRS